MKAAAREVPVELGQSVLPSGLHSLRSSDLDARRGVLPAVGIISLL